MKNIYLIAGLLAVMLFSCKKNDDFLYKGTDVQSNDAANSIYFKIDDPAAGVQGDTAILYYEAVSFFTTIKNDSICKIKVTVLGETSKQDRLFRIVPENEFSQTSFVKDTVVAKLGYHYTILDNQCVIPADSSVGYAYLNVKRPVKEDSVILIQLQLLPNESFNINYQLERMYEVVQVKQQYKRTTHIKLIIKDGVQQPARWPSSMGVWTKKKYFLVMEFFELTFDDFSTTGVMGDLGMASAYALVFKNYLAEMAAQGKTIYEDDGTPMKLP